MIEVLSGQDFEDTSDFVKELNKARLANKNKWIFYRGNVNGRRVEIKTYDTGYLQIMRVDDLHHNAPMDMKVGAWKEFIEKSVNHK